MNSLSIEQIYIELNDEEPEIWKDEYNQSYKSRYNPFLKHMQIPQIRIFQEL